MAEHELNKIVDDDGEVFNLRDSTKQPTADRVTAWGSTPSDTKYPSEKLVKDSLDAKAPNAVTTEAAIATGDKLLFSDASDSSKTKRMSTGFDTGVTNTMLRKDGTFAKVLYADEGWGGTWGTALAPMDTYLLQQRNCFFGAKPSAIAVEYSTDGGSTWIDYGLNDDQKRNLFSQYAGTSVACGKHTHILPTYTGSIVGTKDLSNANVANQRLRITICCRSLATEGTTTQTDKWLYANIRRVGIYMSTNSASKGPRHCVFTAKKREDFNAGNDTWINFGDYAISGDSGWNSIPCNNKATSSGITLGDSFSGQYAAFRFEVWSEGVNDSPAPSQTGNMIITKIVAFSELCWTNNSSNSNLANYGMPCTVNATSGNTNFPKGITSGVAIPVGSGGTGKTSVTAGNYLVGNGTSALTEKTPNAAANDLINALSTGDATPTGEDYYVAQYAGGGTTTKTYHRRPIKALWEYIKAQISSVLGLTATTYGGNAATATALSAGADRTKLDGIAAGAEVNVQSDWNQATTTADDFIKNKPTIPSGTQLVYDCGTGSTSTTDFDNALAAFNAGNWVIIHSSGNTYHCVGTYNSGLRFKQIANETASIKVNTLNWTRGSAPSVGTQLEPSMPGHTHSQYVEKDGDTMSGNLTISKGANQGDTKFVTSRTDTGTTGWFGVGDGGQNHGVYSETANANTNNEVDNDTKGWVVRTDENGYSTLTGAVDGLFSKYFGNTETLRGMKRFKFGYSLDLEGDYTHVSATAIIEARLYSAGVSGGTITMLFNASAQGDERSYYRLQVLSSNNWNLNSVCPVLIVQQSSATAKRMYLGLVSGGPTSTTLMTFSYTEVKVLPLNGARKFNWSFEWDTNDFNSNTMTMIKPYVYPRAQIGTAVGDANTPVYVKNDGSFGTASGVDVAVALKDAGRGDVAGTSGHIVKVGYDNSSVPATTPSGASTYAAGATVGTTKNLVTSYRYDGVAFYKDVDSGNVTVGNSLKWNGLNLVMSSTSTPAAATLYIF